MISRRSLLGGAAATAASFLAGCATTKFRTYDGPAVTGVVVSKGSRRLYLLNGPSTLRAFDIELGNSPIGPKRIEGDGRTPEGAYTIDRRNPQ